MAGLICVREPKTGALKPLLSYRGGVELIGAATTRVHIEPSNRPLARLIAG